MSLPSNQLNLSESVNKNMKNSDNKPKFYSKVEFDKKGKKHETVIVGSVDNIMTSEQSLLNAVAFTKHPISPQIAVIDAKSKPNMKINQSKHNKSKGSSVAQLKANSAQKNFLRNRRINDGANSLANQQRVKEILRQKQILQDLLNEHEKLQRDRQVLAGEMQSMKTYLSDIREKLDSSLRKLSANKTIVGSISIGGSTSRSGPNPTRSNNQRLIPLDSRLKRRN